MKKIIAIIVLMFWSVCLFSAESILFNILPDKNQKYVIQLNNGDLLTGYVVEMINHPDEGEGIRFVTDLGAATIYENQISLIKTEQSFYRHNHRVFLLPTAEPIGGNHFIGNVELMLFYAGGGIGDWLSITAGRTFVPGTQSKLQGTLLNGKLTIAQMPLDANKKLSFAIGANLAFVNDNNRMIHYYGVSTLSLDRSSITAALFYKGGSSDFYEVYYGSGIDKIGGLTYADGSFGLGLGLDTRFKDMQNLHFIGELWNSDITKPTNTAVMLGLRLCSYRFSADFGFSFFTQPFIAPFCSFVWTPFN